jgi:two-component SAPR family response regulator
MALLKANQEFKKTKEANGFYLSWVALVHSSLTDWNDGANTLTLLEDIGHGDPNRIDCPNPIIKLQLATHLAAALARVDPGNKYCHYWHDLVFTQLSKGQNSQLEFTMATTIINYYIWMGDQEKYLFLAKKIKDICRQGNSISTPKIWLWAEALFKSWGPKFSSKEALLSIDQSLDIGPNPQPHIVDHVFLTTAVIAANSQNKFTAARRYIKALDTSVSSSQHSHSLLYYCLAYYQMRKEHFCKATDFANRAVRLATKTNHVFAIMLCNYCLSQIKICQQEFDTAQKLINETTKMNSTIYSNEFKYKLDLLDAYILIRKGREKAGLSKLKQALSLGRQINMLSGMIWWHPHIIAELCHIALDAKIEVAFITEVIQTCKLQPRLSASENETWPWPVKIFTMGRLTICQNNIPIQFKGKTQEKPLALLKIIISLGGRQVSKLQITEYLWPNVDGDKQEQVLGTTLHRLRKLLGLKEAIIMEDGKITINPKTVWVDIWSVEQQYNSALTTWKRHKDVAIILCNNALKQYRGAYLANDDEVWSILTRERLQDKYFQIFMRLSQHYQNLRQYDSALNLYKHGLTIFPLSQELYLGRMQCHHALGNPAEATRTYKKCADLLLSQLSMKPGKQLNKYHQHVTEFLKEP